MAEEKEKKSEKSAHVKADLIQLEKVGGKFVKEGARVISEDAVVERAYAEQFNKDHKGNGKFYDIDEKASAELKEVLGK